MRDFRSDIIDLFERRCGGHVQHWLYSDQTRGQLTGSELWRAFTHSSRAYYIPNDEIELIQKHGNALLAESQADAVVDFGVGSERVVRSKVMPIVNGLSNVRIYAGVDISAAMLKKAATAMTAERPDMTVETHEADFHGSPLRLTGSKRLGLIFGCSVTNQNSREGDGFPRAEIAENLRDFQKHLGAGSELLVTYDANPDPTHAMSAYDNPYWSRHVTGLMYDVARELKVAGDFNPAAWSHEIRWDEAAKVIHQCVVAEREQTLVMDDREYRFRQGERFVAVNNYKFPELVFRGLCEDAGYTVGRSAALKTMRLQHLAM